MHTETIPPKPSAMLVARLRAAHQFLDRPPILDDPLALKILGAEEEARLRADIDKLNEPSTTALRTILVIRSRLAEDSWRDARRRGVTQHVTLGAGLDTMAYRGDTAAARLFEVDLPATQRWKRGLLEAAGIPVPATLSYVATDFEEGALAPALAAAGFDRGAPACFSWLGVTLYLEPGDVEDTLRHIAGCAPGSSVVFDYVVAPELQAPADRAAMDAISASLAHGGEPWKSNFHPDALDRMLRGLGYSRVEHFDRERMAAMYLAGRGDQLHLGSATRMVRATV
ncbi:class I SAM-dependent methyltransferase [Pseudoduganella namucuonensis]|uniref:S-adenosyl-L-methionine-dependent methyltransferase n=1 Tax=Pseudoduganella namucuonensis TaxID=1035707 RepID=A0A1I7LQV5_9BURK|nr:class I SAM-dependent methyltransferase [Pseudoduganella namucuonensis]SFV12044.1 methyltransferase, TIGR00027 family [Pseudoduganella namucuonensis]